jgi:tRNA pseudouridine55 synthase
MGTLDPAAEGVLPLAVGKATRLISFVEGDSKEYEAELILGVATATWDITGEVVATSDATHLDESHVLAALPRFVGEIWQEPPMFSAIKVDGRKLVDLARQGLDIPRAHRKVEIRRIDILAWYKDEARRIAKLRISCAKGTYIRSLCRDIGAYLGVAACMGKLTRTRSGPFALRDSVTLGDFKCAPARHIVTIENFLQSFPRVTIDEAAEARFMCGQRITGPDLPAGEFAVFVGSRCLGLAVGRQGLIIPTRVLAREENPKC